MACEEDLVGCLRETDRCFLRLILNPGFVLELFLPTLEGFGGFSVLENRFLGILEEFGTRYFCRRVFLAWESSWILFSAFS